MSAYLDFGTALYNFVTAIDISAASEDGWASTFNRLPKSDEMDTYPCLAVTPARDERVIGDSVHDDVSLTYSVYIFVQFMEANNSEAELRELADIVTNELAKERREPEPLGGSYTLTIAGEWGFDPDQVQRFYRIDVTARFLEEIT